MVPITIKLDPESIAALDRYVEQGVVDNRTDALRAALASWLSARREDEIVATYQRAYRDSPDHALDEWAEHGRASLADWSRDEGDDVSELLP